MQTAVFLLNMGGPDSVEAVRPFLENLFSDPAIIRFPLAGLVRKPLAKLIASRRADHVAVQYKAMGGKSPLKEITLAQAGKLAEELGAGFTVHTAMRYWHPFADEAVLEAKRAGAGRIIVVPLYPHYSSATTGSSLADLERALTKGGLDKLPRRTVTSWERFTPYVEALAECVRERVTESPGTFILFSAHGLPVKLIEEGDPYLGHIQTTVREVMAKFPGSDHMLAFQSRAGPVRWLEPSTEEALKTLAARGVKDVTVVAVSFVSDHIETLREIDVQYRDEAQALGIERFTRAPSLNLRPSFIAALKDLVLLEAETLR